MAMVIIIARENRVDIISPLCEFPSLMSHCQTGGLITIFIMLPAAAATRSVFVPAAPPPFPSYPGSPPPAHLGGSIPYSLSAGSGPGPDPGKGKKKAGKAVTVTSRDRRTGHASAALIEKNFPPPRLTLAFLRGFRFFVFLIWPSLIF